MKAVRCGWPAWVAGDAVSSEKYSSLVQPHAIVFYGAPVPSRARIAAQITPGDRLPEFATRGQRAISCDNSCDNSWPIGRIHGHSRSVDGGVLGSRDRQNRNSEVV